MRQLAERRPKPNIFSVELYTGERIGVIAKSVPGVELDSVRLSTGNIVSERHDPSEPKIPVRAWKMIGVPADGDHMESIVIRAETKNRPLIRRISKHDFLQWPQVFEAEIDGKQTHYVERQIKNITLGSQCIWSKTGKKEDERIWQVLGAMQGNKLLIETILDPHEYAAIDITEFENQGTPKMIKIENPVEEKKPVMAMVQKEKGQDREHVEHTIRQMRKEVTDFTAHIQELLEQEPKVEAVLSAIYLLNQEQERISDYMIELDKSGGLKSEQEMLQKLYEICDEKGLIPLNDFIKDNLEHSSESYIEHGNRALDEASYTNSDEQEVFNDLLLAITLFKNLKNSDDAELEALEAQTVKLLQGKLKFRTSRHSSLENGQAISREAFTALKSDNSDKMRKAYTAAEDFLTRMNFLGVPVHKTQLEKYFELKRSLETAITQLRRRGANQNLRVKREEQERKREI